MSFHCTQHSSFVSDEQYMSERGGQCKDMESTQSFCVAPLNQYSSYHDNANISMKRSIKGNFRPKEYNKYNNIYNSEDVANDNKVTPSSMTESPSLLDSDICSNFIKKSSSFTPKNNGYKYSTKDDHNVASLKTSVNRQRKPVRTRSEIKTLISHTVRRQQQSEQHGNITDIEERFSDVDSTVDDQSSSHHRYDYRLAPSDSISVMSSFTVDDILMDLTDQEDALSRKSSSIRRGGKSKLSRSRPRIRRNVSDPIRSIISNDGDIHNKNGKFKKVPPDAASDCSSVTDFTEDHIVPLNKFVKNLSLPNSSIGDNICAKKCHDSIRLNNIHDVGKSSCSSKNTSRATPINHQPFFTPFGDTSGKETLFKTTASSVLSRPQPQLQCHEVVDGKDKDRDPFNETVSTMSSSVPDLFSSTIDVTPSRDSTFTSFFKSNTSIHKMVNNSYIEQRSRYQDKCLSVSNEFVVNSNCNAQFKDGMKEMFQISTNEIQRDGAPIASTSVPAFTLGQISDDDTDSFCDNEYSFQKRRNSKLKNRSVVNISNVGASKVFRSIFRRKTAKALINKSSPSSTDPSAEAAEMRRRLALSNGSGKTGPMYKRKEKKGAWSALSFVVPTNTCAFPPEVVITTRKDLPG